MEGVGGGQGYGRVGRGRERRVGLDDILLEVA